MNLQYKIKKSGRLINVELISGRIAIISSSAAFIDETIENNQLACISYEGEISFKLQQEIEFNLKGVKSKFIIKQIDKQSDISGRYYLSCSTINLTSWFLMPLISCSSTQTKRWFGWDSYMINSYLNSNLKQLVIIYRFFPGALYATQESKLMTHENYLTMCDPTTYTVAYTFCFKDLHYKDVEMFIDGKYSLISDVGKRKILNFHNNKKQELKDILNKSDSRREKLEEKFGMKLSEDIELYSKPNLLNEIYE